MQSAQIETAATLDPNLDEVEEIELERDSQVSRSELSQIPRLLDSPMSARSTSLPQPGTGHRVPSTPLPSNSYLSVSPLDQQIKQSHTHPGRNFAAQVAAAHQAPRCCHIKASGLRCAAPALRGGEFCYFHNHTHNAPRLIYPSLSRLEDAHGIQIALMEVLAGIMDGRIEHKTGALLLYGLQTAVSNLKHMPEIDPADVTIDRPEAQDRLSRVDAKTVVAAEKAAVADAVDAALDHLAARHPIPGRPSGDTARVGRYAELMASYYRHDPDSPDRQYGITPDNVKRPGGDCLPAVDVRIGPELVRT